MTLHLAICTEGLHFSAFICVGNTSYALNRLCNTLYVDLGILSNYGTNN